MICQFNTRPVNLKTLNFRNITLSVYSSRSAVLSDQPLVYTGERYLFDQWLITEHKQEKESVMLHMLTVFNVFQFTGLVARFACFAHNFGIAVAFVTSFAR